MITKTFNHAEALAIQRQHLKMWASILKPEIFAKVEEAVLAKNDPMPIDPYNVCRGTDIDAIVHNMQVRTHLYEVGEAVLVAPKTGPMGGHEFMGRIVAHKEHYYTVKDQDDDAFDVEEGEISLLED